MLKKTLLLLGVLFSLATTAAYSQSIHLDSCCIDDIYIPDSFTKKGTLAVPDFSQYLSKIHCDPYVVYEDESFNLYCSVKRDDIHRIIIHRSFYSYNEDSIVLYDNGLNGDLQANDNIFTASNLNVKPLNYPNQTSGTFFRYTDFTYQFDDGSVATENLDLGLGIRVISREVDIPEVKAINDSIQYTSHVVNIIEDWDWNYFWANSYWLYSTKTHRDYYKYFIDDRDFLLTSTTYPTPEGPAGSFSRGIYSLKSIGIDRIQGLINTYYTYAGSSSLMNHEILHNWAAYLPEELDLAIPGGHWGVVKFPSSGFGGGWQAYPNFFQYSDSIYRAYSNDDYTGHYNSLELYLMGIIPFDSVSFPIRTLVNFEWIGNVSSAWVPEENEYRYCKEFIAEGIRNVDKNEFMGRVEIKEYTDSLAQKDFGMSQIVVSDRLLSAKEMAYYQWHMEQYEKQIINPTPEEYAYNFFWATRGRGTMTTRLSTPKTMIDEDNDGYSLFEDCNDQDSLINPGIIEIPNNNIDENCDGEILIIDNDKDGYNSSIDCNDSVYTINPGVDEIPNNDVDENCDGIALIIDEDSDGFNSSFDCNDQDSLINPGALEIVNNDVDEDCDGIAQQIDNDNDGYNSDVDCNDSIPSINPGNDEIPNNDVDENCDGVVLVIDNDYDGFNSDEDCNDLDSLIYPGAEEIPNNGIDEDCDGFDMSTVYISVFEDNGLSIYPNPTNHLLTIETKDIGTYQVSISSMNGLIIYDHEISESTYQVDLSQFPKGVYIITIRSKDYVTIRKIIKL